MIYLTIKCFYSLFYRHSDEVVDRGEFIKKCGERWKTMTAKEKNKFNQMQELDKKRFQTEMQVYNQVQNCECFCSTQLWCKHSSHIEWLIYWVFHLLQQTTK